MFGILCLTLCKPMDARATSLYTPSTFQAMTSDLRMRRVGDLVTVLVYETSSATSTANTSATRDAAVGLDVAGTGKRVAANIGTGNQMDGRGRTQREGRVLAQITVAIQQITEHGDMLVMGEQLLDINNEQQQIRVEGRIRPQDISDANVVLSTRIANAKISYTGQGDIADKQRSAWWQRLLTFFGV